MMNFAKSTGLLWVVLAVLFFILEIFLKGVFLALVLLVVYVVLAFFGIVPPL